MNAMRLKPAWTFQTSCREGSRPRTSASALRVSSTRASSSLSGLDMQWFGSYKLPHTFLIPPCLRQENFLFSDSESQSDPLGSFEIWPFSAGLVPADRSVVPKTKNAG